MIARSKWTSVMRTRALSASLIASVCTLCQPALAAPAYQTIDVPGASGTQISAINDAGTIGGSFFVTGGGTHSFIRTADGTFTTFDPPGSNDDEVRGIDAAGDTVGVTIAFRVPQCFIRTAAGVFTIFGRPKGSANACYVMSINSSGYTAGEGDHGPRKGEVSYAFVRPPRGKLTKFLTSAYDGIEVPPDGLNNSGTLVGSALSGTSFIGFIRAADGTITTFTAPGTGNTQASGINDNGTIVGGVGTPPAQGFIRAPDGTFSLFSISGATGIDTGGINANGDVTGSYNFGNRMSGGFVRSAKGDLKTFTVDGGYTEAFGINSSGVIAGSYSDAQGIAHGFIRTP